MMTHNYKKAYSNEKYYWETEYCKVSMTYTPDWTKEQHKNEMVYYFISADVDFIIDDEKVHFESGDVLYMDKDTIYSAKDLQYEDLNPINIHYIL